MNPMDKLVARIRPHLKKLGPGIITGAADDDPSGIATYSQTGAQFGFAQLWLALYSLPFMLAVQEGCARIGAVTGHGLASVIEHKYGRKIVLPLVLLLLVANTINIGADLGAMAASIQLLLPGSFTFWALVSSGTILLLEIFTSYHTYSKILKWLALSLLAYPLTLIFAHIPWGRALTFTIVPHVELNFQFFFIVTGVLGTTISPYLFFWEASEEVEEKANSHLNRNTIFNLRLDNIIGMFVSNVATWSIIVLAATVLNTHNINDIRTAADAAKSLEPLVGGSPWAGYASKIIFATGIIGLGLLGIPVLSGSAAYAVSEIFSWKEGLNRRPSQAKGFYTIIVVSTLVGLFTNFLGINPMKLLVYAAVFNGLAAAPLIFFIAKIASDKKTMGEFRSGPLSAIFLWGAFALMALSSISLFLYWINP